MKNYWKELVILLLALAGIAFYAYKHFDISMLQKSTISMVEINGKKFQ